MWNITIWSCIQGIYKRERSSEAGIQTSCMFKMHTFVFTGAPEHIQGLNAECIFWDQSEQRGPEMTTRRVDSSWELQAEVPRATKHGRLKRAAMILGILLICKFVFNFSDCKTRFSLSAFCSLLHLPLLFVVCLMWRHQSVIIFSLGSSSGRLGGPSAFPATNSPFSLPLNRNWCPI